jgi:hypothetical protein
VATYRVWVQLPAARLALQAPLDVRGTNAAVYATVLDTPLGPFAAGILVRLDLEASSIRQALDLATGMAAGLLDMLALAHGVALSDPEPVLAIAHPTDAKVQAFAQFIAELPVEYPLRRFFAADRFGPLFTALDGLTDERAKDRIRRAMTLFRRHLLDKDPVDAYEDLWEALETLNPLIQARHGLPTTQEGGKCAVCGQSIETPTATGIRHAIVALGQNDEKLWKELRALRVGIVHGKLAHKDAAPRTLAALPHLQAALARAVVDLLSLPAELSTLLSRKPLRPGALAQALMVAEIHTDSPRLPTEPGEVPFAIPSAKTSAATGDTSQPGRRTLTFDFSWTLHNLLGELRDIQIDLLIAKDPEDEGATLEQTAQRVIRPDA